MVCVVYVCVCVFVDGFDCGVLNVYYYIGVDVLMCCEMCGNDDGVCG